MTDTYHPRRLPTQRSVSARGLTHHLTVWGKPETSALPVLWMLHGFMDVGASFQFVVDALDAGRAVIAPDWRGFGQTPAPAAADSFWFPDYLADLDALLDAVSPTKPVDLAGHSMGGNVAMAYAAVRPARVRRLINLEGFGLPDSPPAEAPQRLTQWLDQIKTPAQHRPYPSRQEVADRMRRNNPRLPAEKAWWLASHWAEPGRDGQWHLRAHAAHKHVNPVLYRAAEAQALWSAIQAPTLWVQADGGSSLETYWQGRYTQAEFDARLALVPNCQREHIADAGHMLHHDQPEALARVLQTFLNRD